MIEYILRKSKLLKLMAVCGLLISPSLLMSQVNSKDSLLAEVTLKSAIDYAFIHQPLIQQSLIDQEIVESNIKSKLSEIYPQIHFNYNLQHNFIVPTSVIGGNNVKLGVSNTSSGQFTFTQTIFEKDVIFANKSKSDFRQRALQTTASNKIDLAVEVSKAFYDVLSTMQQIRISNENIVRIERSLKDAFNQYNSGVTDKIDYKRATINLNNSKANQKSNEALLHSKLEYLKSLMGYPISARLNIVYDSAQFEKEIELDTLQTPDYNARIEYQLLETQKRLLQYNLKFNKWSYLPDIYANGAYNLNYLNNNFGKLYSNNYPNSYGAITLGIPIFQGGKRKADVHLAELDLHRNELDIVNLRNRVNAEYNLALATYKASLQYYLALKENIVLAQEVYDVVQLQYRSGIKSYLEVVTAESDLRTTQITYFTAMYTLIAGKIDVLKALGQVRY